MALSIESLIVKWNNEWSWDYLWRKKYNISFNSPAHREMNPLDIRMDIVEEVMVREQMRKDDERKEDEKHFKKTGEWWKTPEDVLNENEEEMFDNLDISDI